MTIPWWRTSVGKEEVFRLIDAIANEHLSQGPVVAELEKQISEAMDVPYVVVTTSGSVALVIALMAMDIGSNDEVIVPNRTWIATAHAPLLVGAKAVVVDVRKDLPAMDASQVVKKITSRTKAIMPVHLNGRSEDMQEIKKIARKYRLKVIEDAAQAMFSSNSYGLLGCQSDAGCFSLGVAKLITIGQGGFVVTRNKKIYENLLLVRNHGLTNNFHPTFFRVGCNYRTTDVLASMGIEQLKRVPERIEHLNSLYKRYQEGLKYLPFIKLIPVDVERGEVPLYIEVVSGERDKLMKYLETKKIESRPFLPNVNDAPYIKAKGRFPNSAIFRDTGMTLPCGPEQPLKNVDKVIEVLKSYA